MSDPTPTLAIFTAAQRRVVALVAAGRSLEDVARVTETTPWTVRHHLANAGSRIPEQFYPDLTSAKNRRARLLMWYALAVATEQLELAA